MSKCNATLTTATLSPCRSHPIHPPDESTYCVPVAGGHTHIKLHGLVCEQPEWSMPHTDRESGHYAQGVHWRDDTPGAKPSDPPLVTEAEILAAYDATFHEATRAEVPFDVPNVTVLRKALEAAARVRLENE